MNNIYTTPEHELLRDQVARFIEREAEPPAAWQEQGSVPRDVLRCMGRAGLLGRAFESEYGGADADADADALGDLYFIAAKTGSARHDMSMGGMGDIRETAIEWLWRDARVLAIGGGGGATAAMLEKLAKRYRWPDDARRRHRLKCFESESMKPSEALALHRPAIRAVVEAHRARNARVFGSALHGLDTEQSDLDILIDPTQETTMFDIGAIRWELRTLLGVPVDVLTPNALPEKFRARVLAQAMPV